MDTKYPPRMHEVPYRIAELNAAFLEKHHNQGGELVCSTVTGEPIAVIYRNLTSYAHHLGETRRFFAAVKLRELERAGEWDAEEPENDAATGKGE